MPPSPQTQGRKVFDFSHASPEKKSGAKIAGSPGLKSPGAKTTALGRAIAAQEAARRRREAAAVPGHLGGRSPPPPPEGPEAEPAPDFPSPDARQPVADTLSRQVKVASPALAVSPAQASRSLYGDMLSPRGGSTSHLQLASRPSASTPELQQPVWAQGQRLAPSPSRHELMTGVNEKPDKSKSMIHQPETERSVHLMGRRSDGEILRRPELKPAPVQRSRFDARGNNGGRSKMEMRMHGGHYDYEVSTAAQMKQDMEEKQVHDRTVADRLHHDGTWSSRSLAASQASATAHNARTAFTDRSIRVNEGLHLKKVLSCSSPTPAAGPLAHKDCSCAVCKPFVMAPAGTVSPTFASKKVIHMAHTDELDASRPRDGTVPVPKTTDSRLMRKVIHCREDDVRGRPEVQAEAEMLGRSMGRKGPRSPRARSSEASGVAGTYNRTVGGGNPTTRGRMQWQDKPGEPPRRKDMHMIMSPRPGQDPQPDLRVGDSRKASGDCRILSSEAEAQTVLWNQHNYRYDVSAHQEFRKSPRAYSQPPQRNPVNHEGWNDNAREVLGYTARGDSKRFSPRGPISSISDGVRALTNHDRLNAEAVDERSRRLQSETHFSTLCAATEESKQRQLQAYATIAGSHHTWISPGVGAALTWDG